MKVIIMLRGPYTDLKDDVFHDVVKTLNPDVNHITCFPVDLRDHERQNGGNLRAAGKSAINLSKKIIAGSHQEKYLVVNNESLIPQHWEAYTNIGERLGVETVIYGVDIYLENISNGDSRRKNNLQTRNCDTFKVICTKYYRINSLDDIPPLLSELRNEAHGE